MIRYRNTNRDTSFGDVISNIYDEIVLKIFINTIAKPHVKRLTSSPLPCTTTLEIWKTQNYKNSGKTEIQEKRSRD